MTFEAFRLIFGEIARFFTNVGQKLSPSWIYTVSSGTPNETVLGRHLVEGNLDTVPHVL